jgi:hypothetical protein
MISPRCAAGGAVTELPGIVSAPVGWTLPIPFCQLTVPL